MLVLFSGTYAKTKEGETWIWQFRDEEEENEAMLIIIFATTANLHHLSRAKVWYGDGIFKVCPDLFYQLYTLHAEVHGQIVPLVYSLLPSKSQSCYRFMWMKLNELMTQKGLVPHVEEYKSDLEFAAINTITAVFIPESISTCFFHFAQAHWRKIQSLGLMEHYIHDQEYSMLLRSFTALTFVPNDRVVEYFKILCTSVPAEYAEEISPFVDYMAEAYIGKEVYEIVNGEADNGRIVLRLRREPRWQNPKFQPKLWCVYERVLNDEPRTTNMLEGWHRRFGIIVAKHHPNIYDFIGCLRSEQSRTETLVSKLIMGEEPKDMKHEIKVKNKRIKKIVQQFGERDPIAYLKGLAYNIRHHAK